jgi:hypothetical protein
VGEEQPCDRCEGRGFIVLCDGVLTAY